MDRDSAQLQTAWKSHERRWRNNRYVYAVVSRRSGGVSVGINLNPDKACNFDCIYCQVDRTTPPVVRRVDLDTLREELRLVLEAERDGSLYVEVPFDSLPPTLRGIRDIAFSGDGEPTTYRYLPDAVRIVADARYRYGLTGTKIVLITDSAYLGKPVVKEALRLMDFSNGEIWAKLDAGTEEYFRAVNRPNVSLQTIVDNILEAARQRPLVIQSIWMQIREIPPPVDEVNAYCLRLNGILAAGGRLKAIQIYTIARQTTEPWATPLADADLDRIAAAVRTHVPVPVETFYGVRSD